jgi:hypothetical protein
MAKFISDGIGVHSIEDNWTIPEGWHEISASDAEAIYPPLFGEPKAAPSKPAKASASK